METHPQIQVIDNISSPTTSTNQPTKLRNRTVILSVVVVTLIFVFGIILSIYSEVNTHTSPNNYQPSGNSSGSTNSISTDKSTSSTGVNLITFQLSQPMLNSDQFTDPLYLIQVDLSDSWAQTLKNNVGFTLKNEDAYMVFQTLPEDTGTLYEQKLTTSIINTSQFGDIYRVTLPRGATSEHLKNNLGADGAVWYAYSSNYTETGCGSIFDPTSGISSPAAACGNLTVAIRDNDLSGTMIVNCVGQSQEDATKCDQLIRSVKISLSRL